MLVMSEVTSIAFKRPQKAAMVSAALISNVTFGQANMSTMFKLGITTAPWLGVASV